MVQGVGKRGPEASSSCALSCVSDRSRAELGAMEERGLLEPKRVLDGGGGWS